MNRQQFINKWGRFFNQAEERDLWNDLDSVIAQQPISEEVVCPFCHENDFDKLGLKIHLQQYCEIYKNM